MASPDRDTARHVAARPRFESGTSSEALFVFRLRLHRERRKLTLDQIARVTRIRRELLEALEHNDLSEWPRGIFARAWMRQYAQLVGLDPEETVDEFCRLFPNGDRRASTLLREISTLLSWASEYRDEEREVERRRSAHSRALDEKAMKQPSALVRLVRRQEPGDPLWRRADAVRANP